jgi:hypothetical protein
MSTLTPWPAAVSGDGTPFATIALDPDVPASEKAVLMALVAHDGAACYRALRLATGLQGSSLQRAVRGLEDRGLARRERLDSTTWAVILVECLEEEEEAPRPSHDGRPVATDRSRVCPEERVNILPSGDTPRPDDPPLVGELVANGVWRRVAVRLAREYDEALIRFWVEQARLWGPDIRNRGGWIKCALDEGYRPTGPDPRTEPGALRERLAEAVWAAMDPRDRYDLLAAAKAENAGVCRTAREIASWLPQCRGAMNAAIGMDFLRRHRLERV